MRIDEAAGAVVLTVRVISRATRSGVGGTRGEALLVRVQAPPVDGAANDELLDVIAAALEVPRRSVSLVSGGRSRQKRVRVAGIDAATARARLTEP